MGDWNMEPAELVKPQWWVAPKYTTITPANAIFTCNAGSGSMIDYSLASTNLANLIYECRVKEKDLIKTHSPVAYKMCFKRPLPKTYQLVRPKKLEYISGPWQEWVNLTIRINVSNLLRTTQEKPEIHNPHHHCMH